MHQCIAPTPPNEHNSIKMNSPPYNKDELSTAEDDYEASSEQVNDDKYLNLFANNAIKLW